MRKNIVVMLSVGVLMLSGADARADSVYKCKNRQGELIYQESPCTQDAQTISSWEAAILPAPQKEEKVVVIGSYIIKQGDAGHYFIDGTINGKPLTFLVDTGATAVALPREIAYVARMSCDEQVRMNTANGSASACLAVISTLKFGPFTLKNVPATIVPNLDQPLLGMNVLQQFKIEQDNGEMKISNKDNKSGGAAPAAVQRQE